MSEEIIITVDQKGGLEIEAQGFKGKGCSLATKELENSLGKVTADQKKPEFYQQQAAGHGQKARG